MKDPYLESLLKVLATVEFNPDRPHLISVDELRAAGALDVPPAWRNSLQEEPKREYYPLFPDDDLAPVNPQPAPIDSEDDVEDDVEDHVEDDAEDDAEDAPEDDAADDVEDDAEDDVEDDAEDDAADSLRCEGQEDEMGKLTNG